jgi:hypothetical protein
MNSNLNVPAAASSAAPKEIRLVRKTRVVKITDQNLRNYIKGDPIGNYFCSDCIVNNNGIHTQATNNSGHSNVPLCDDCCTQCNYDESYVVANRMDKLIIAQQQQCYYVMQTYDEWVSD